MEAIKPTSYRELEGGVLRWSEARKIIPRSTPAAQAVKTLEEAGELLVAAAEVRVLNKMAALLEPHGPAMARLAELRGKAVADLEDAVGDVVVTLINVCALADIDLVLCLGKAYKEIRHRTGTLGEDGIFRKDVPVGYAAPLVDGVVPDGWDINKKGG